MSLKSVITACFVVSSAGSAIHADIIPPDHHPVARCITVTNLDAFPDIVLVGGYVPVSNAQHVERYIVKPDSCLTMGYKFNRFYLFWVLRSYLDEQGVENLPLKSLLPLPAKRQATIVTTPQIGLISPAVNPYGGTLPDANPVVREQLHYQLYTNNENGNFLIHLIEKITTDTAGKETRTTMPPVAIHNTLPHKTPAATTTAFTARLTSGRLDVTAHFDGSLKAQLIDCNGRTITQLTRGCHAGSTYSTLAPELSAGMYWLRLTHNGARLTLPLNNFR